MKLESGIRKSIERDENGNVINEIFFDETRNVKVMSIEYEYNPDGKVKKETLYDGFSNCVEILYSYDERGNCTEIRETEYNNGKQSYCHIRHNYYDNKNSMCMRIHVPFFVHLLALYLCQYKQRGIIMDNINEQCLETNMQHLSTLIETQYHENNKRKKSTRRRFYQLSDSTERIHRPVYG